MFKIIARIEKKDGGGYWLRVGSAFENRDASMNLYLDAIPPPNSTSHRYEFQLRELDAEDLRKREAWRDAGHRGAESRPHAPAHAADGPQPEAGDRGPF
jgi:phosphatidylethanolamine-binding protein (PEBP) family uncharacterized protein